LRQPFSVRLNMTMVQWLTNKANVTVLRIRLIPEQGNKAVGDRDTSKGVDRCLMQEQEKEKNGEMGKIFTFLHISNDTDLIRLSKHALQPCMAHDI